jgi:hypothetical protein
VALFAVGSHVSIISDTSQRGYRSNRVFGKVTAVYLSADGTYLYDVHKIIDSYTRLKVKQSELEYLHGYSSNDWEGYVLEPRQGSENTRSQLKRAAQELSVAVGEVKRFKKLDLKNNKAVKKLESKNRQLELIVKDVRNAHSLFNSRHGGFYHVEVCCFY